eukprot:TRINITY_DN104997_c0_g2_i2.p1 TRINITY_DN104997_c0_g2~~TRINITY_DN104997_c0_g2_i2.p1  ORF type:complete len:292 (+),score=52.24 TRINITY_DN104997_c0_g2_i2:114-989(+)
MSWNALTIPDSWETTKQLANNIIGRYDISKPLVIEKIAMQFARMNPGNLIDDGTVLARTLIGRNAVTIISYQDGSIEYRAYDKITMEKRVKLLSVIEVNKFGASKTHVTNQSFKSIAEFSQVLIDHASKIMDQLIKEEGEGSKPLEMLKCIENDEVSKKEQIHELEDCESKDEHDKVKYKDKVTAESKSAKLETNSLKSKLHRKDKQQRHKRNSIGRRRSHKGQHGRGVLLDENNNPILTKDQKKKLDEEEELRKLQQRKETMLKSLDSKNYDLILPNQATLVKHGHVLGE